MQVNGLISSIVDPESTLGSSKLVEMILPIKENSYSFEEIEGCLRLVSEEVEALQNKTNNYFDEVLRENAKDQLQSLCQSLHTTQLDVMKLQCEIAFTKEQYETVNSISNSPLIQERREMILKEDNLKRSFQQLKFQPMREFFERFADHLSDSVSVCRKICTQQTFSYHQLFDWTHYHQVIFLLRACGKALIDVERFERLYRSNVNFVGMTFKQPIDRMDFNNFIGFPDTYSLESQLEIIITPNERKDLKGLLTDLNNDPVFDSKDPVEYVVFHTHHQKIKSITIECCKLLVDLNMNYVEAHLTDGINIDKLNGTDFSALQVSEEEEQPLPLYAMSPQEYITQIGQHLLTLRKQTEQFNNLTNETLKHGLELSQQAQDLPIDVSSSQTVTEIIMRCIARHTIRSLLGRTSTSILSKLTPHGRRQLATDALYLDNVLEDLGLLASSEPNVEKFKALLAH